MKPEIDTFGTRFGRLLRRKRGAKGWSQEQLAVEAFDDEMRSSRIGEWESGQYARPQARNIEALARALDITQDEIDACHPQNASALAFEQRLDALSINLVARIETLSGAANRGRDAEVAANDADAHGILVAYCRAASRAWDRIELIGDWPRQPGTRRRLLSTYIPPALRAAPVRSLGSEGSIWESPVANSNVAPRSENQEATLDRAQLRQALGLLVPEFDRIVLFGRAGIGKSCLLRTLGLGCAARWKGDHRLWKAVANLHALPDRAFLPLLLDLRRVAPVPDEAGWDALVRESVRQLAAELGESADAVRRAIQSYLLAGGDALLMVDGVDEADEVSARRLVELVDAAQHAHPEIRVILASRWSRGRLIRSRISAEEIELLDLDMAGRRALLERLYADAEFENPESFSDALIETLGASPILLQASSTPLFLELLAANLASPTPREPPADETLSRALLTVLFDRRPGPAALLGHVGWERPAAHVALRMLAPDSETIDAVWLHEELGRVFEHLGPAVPVTRRSDPDKYGAAMIDSGLLRAEPVAPSLPAAPRYDFVLDAIKEWLAVTALFENWSPDGFGSNPDADRVVRALLGTLDRPIPFADRERLRLALLAMPTSAATRLLDRIVGVPDADQNLSGHAGRPGARPRRFMAGRRALLRVADADGRARGPNGSIRAAARGFRRA